MNVQFHTDLPWNGWSALPAGTTILLSTPYSRVFVGTAKTWVFLISGDTLQFDASAKTGFSFEEFFVLHFGEEIRAFNRNGELPEFCELPASNIQITLKGLFLDGNPLLTFSVAQQEVTLVVHKLESLPVRYGAPTDTCDDREDSTEIVTYYCDRKYPTKFYNLSRGTYTPVSRLGTLWKRLSTNTVAVTAVAVTSVLLVVGIVAFALYSPNSLRNRGELGISADTVLSSADVLGDDWQFPTNDAERNSIVGYESYDKVDPNEPYGISKAPAPVPRNLKEAQGYNEDVRGWIKVPGTSISEPVLVLSDNCPLHGKPDNDFYLNRNILKERVFSGDSSGVVFADYENIIESRNHLSANTVLYGHNWTNVQARDSEPKIGDVSDRQFAPLASFANPKFAEEHRRVVLTTADGAEVIGAVFAVFYIATDSPQYFAYNVADPDDARMDDIISRAQEASIYQYPVGVNATDKLITLSTCTSRYSASGTGRLVIMAKIVDSIGEVSTAPLN